MGFNFNTKLVIWTKLIGSQVHPWSIKLLVFRSIMLFCYYFFNFLQYINLVLAPHKCIIFIPFLYLVLFLQLISTHLIFIYRTLRCLGQCEIQWRSILIFRPCLVLKNFTTVPITSNLRTHAWSIKCN